MADRLVINTSPLIALARMDAFDVIANLPFEFVCPVEIEAEILDGAAHGHPVLFPAWLTVLSLSAPLSPLTTAALDSGEAAVIQLALEQKVEYVCIDELKGRRAALAVGLKVLGSLGLIGKATADCIRIDTKVKRTCANYQVIRLFHGYWYKSAVSMQVQTAIKRLV